MFGPLKFNCTYQWDPFKQYISDSLIQKPDQLCLVLYFVDRKHTNSLTRLPVVHAFLLSVPRRFLLAVLLCPYVGDLCLFGFVDFLFLLVSGKGCGLWLRHSLDFSLTFFLYVTCVSSLFVSHLSFFRYFGKPVPRGCGILGNLDICLVSVDVLMLKWHAYKVPAISTATSGHYGAIYNCSRYYVLCRKNKNTVKLQYRWLVYRG